MSDGEGDEARGRARPEAIRDVVLYVCSAAGVAAAAFAEAAVGGEP